MKHLKNYSLIAISILTTACAQSSSPVNSEVILEKQNKVIAHEWDDAKKATVEGEAMINKGVNLIEKGKHYIQDGNKKIANGNKAMRNCEASYWENIIEADIHEADDCAG